MKKLFLSLLLFCGISQSVSAMQAPVVNCLPTIPAIAYAIVVAHPVPSAVIGGAGYVGYKTYNYFTTPKTQK